MKNTNQQHTSPPRWPFKILQLCLKQKYLEEIAGDLEERFQDNLQTYPPQKTKILYAWDCVKLLRPGLLKNWFDDLSLTQPAMLKNFIKTGYRSLIRQKEYAILNILGLAMGLAITILTSLWIWDEWSFNTSHQHQEHIAQILKRRTHNGETAVRFSLPIPVMDELRNSYAEDFKYVVVSDWIDKSTLSSNEKNLNISGCYMSEDAPHLLGLTMTKGSRNGLSNPNTLMLSERTARAFFGDEDPIGKPMRVNGEPAMEVAGVYEDLPENSSFRNLGYLANFAMIEANSGWVQRARKEKFWNSNFCQIYVQLSEQADPTVVEDKIRNMISTHTDNASLLASNPELILHRMQDWHLRSEWKNGVQSGGAITNVWIFGSVAFSVLLLSCFNFINLSTARAQVRFKEVGVRKTMGSRRIQLIFQFITESFLVVVVSFLMAMAIAYLLMPYFNTLSGKHLTLPVATFWFWLFSLAILLVTALLASAYPAFFLSSFRPVHALKGFFLQKGSSDYLRHGLVVIQFAVSICLVVSTLVVNTQVKHSKNRDIGYDPAQLITIRTSAKDFKGKHEVLHTELLSSGVVDAVSQSSNPLTEVTSSNDGFSWQGKDPALTTNFITIRVTPEFGQTVHWKITEGRDFSVGRLADEKAFVCNQAAIDFMSLESPIGRTITWRGEAYRIIGVVDDLLMESPFQPVKPAVYFIGPSSGEHMQIRLSDQVETNEALSRIEAVFKSVVPNVPFGFEYVDQTFSRKFKQEEQLGTLLGILTVAAMVIGLLGIFGLSAYVIQQRSKEISIRKVLGASLLSILSLLVSEFVKTMLLSLIIAVPIAWYLLDHWLQGYAYRIDLSLWYFVWTSVLSMALTVIVIGQRSIQVALSNPTKFLKEE